MDDTVKKAFFNKLDKVKKYIDEENKRPSESDTNIAISKLGRWLTSQLRNFRRRAFAMKDNDIYNAFEEFQKEYMSIKHSDWYHELEEVKKFIDENGRRPSKNENNWFATQLLNFYYIRGVMKDNGVYITFKQFLEDNKEQMTLYKSKQTTVITKWLMRFHAINNYIRRHISLKKGDVSWILRQELNFKRRIGIMNDATIYNLFKDFLNDSYPKVKTSISFILS